MNKNVKSALEVTVLTIGAAAGLALVFAALQISSPAAPVAPVSPSSTAPGPTNSTGTPISGGTAKPTPATAPAFTRAPSPPATSAGGGVRPVEFSILITCKDGFVYAVTPDQQRCTHHGGVAVAAL